MKNKLLIFIFIVLFCIFQIHCVANTPSIALIQTSTPKNTPSPTFDSVHPENSFSHDWSLSISICALIISLYSFFYLNLRKGKLIFIKPTFYSIQLIGGERLKGKTYCVGIPLCINNTGAVSHIINYLYCDIRNKENQWSSRYSMALLVDKLPKWNENKMAPSIYVDKFSSIIINLIFCDDKKDNDLPSGDYIIDLYGYIDGKKYADKPLTSFEMNYEDADKK